MVLIRHTLNTPEYLVNKSDITFISIDFYYTCKSGIVRLDLIWTFFFLIIIIYYLLLLLLLLLQLYYPIGISPIENLGCFPRGKPAVTELRYPTYGAC